MSKEVFLKKVKKILKEEGTISFKLLENVNRLGKDLEKINQQLKKLKPNKR